MKIMMMTNTYLPHVGGVARSVAAFSAAYRAAGHEVLVAAPEFDDMDPDERDVVRVAAMQNFNGSDFSVMMPGDDTLDEAVQKFQPDIIHSHHPFLMGAAAQRLARLHNLPLVFTHHTMYEQYTHYAPGDSQLLKRFVSTLSTDYANVAQRVFAPSESIRDILIERGVTTPIDVIPTGVRDTFFSAGSGQGFRSALGIPRNAFVVGHVGRLAPEKNLPFLGEAVARFLKRNDDAIFLLVGVGPSLRDIRQILREHSVLDRLVVTGVLDQPLLTSAYKAMDVFAFASQSETQGMVISEAMATRTPVVAVDAPGVREVVVDGRNGLLLAEESLDHFVDGLQWYHDLEQDARKAVVRAALRTGRTFALPRCADKALNVYQTVINEQQMPESGDVDIWDETLNRIGAEWQLISSLASAAGKALLGDDDDDNDDDGQRAEKAA
ncbi:MAG: glycosyltransferase [Gammaproteobacteria bacterium]|nr:glycosyltransferase [Gammaproteobacteria bacterium]